MKPNMVLVLVLLTVVCLVRRTLLELEGSLEWT